MSNMFRTALGAIVFTVAALFFINYAGNMMTKSGAKSNPYAIVKTPPPKQSQKEEAAAAAKKKAKGNAKAVAARANKKNKTTPTRTVDAAKGYSTFKHKCLGCHTVNKAAPNRTGPNLWGVVGRAKGSKKGFRYSKGLRRLGGIWTEADINRFIAGPRSMVRDTKMTFRGLKARPDRQDIIAFLKTLKD